MANLSSIVMSTCKGEAHPHDNGTLPDSADPSLMLQRLSAGFAAVKSWLETFFDPTKLPLAAYAEISMAVSTQFAQCTVALFRLSTFEAPGIPWDRRRVQQELDLAQAAKSWAKMWDGVPAAAGLDLAGYNNNPWAFTVRAMNAIAYWWEASIWPKIDAETSVTRPPDFRTADTGTSGMGFMPFPTGDFEAMDFTDDSWMREVMSAPYAFWDQNPG